VECLRCMPVRNAGGSGDAGKKKGKKRAEDSGLASELARETKWLGVAGTTEQKRGRDKASRWEKRRQQELRRAVLAAGGERGARVGRQQQRARAVRGGRRVTRGRGSTGDGRR
jgi:hypothetical protein